METSTIVIIIVVAIVLIVAVVLIVYFVQKEDDDGKKTPATTPVPDATEKGFDWSFDSLPQSDGFSVDANVPKKAAKVTSAERAVAFNDLTSVGFDNVNFDTFAMNEPVTGEVLVQSQTNSLIDELERLNISLSSTSTVDYPFPCTDCDMIKFNLPSNAENISIESRRYWSSQWRGLIQILLLIRLWRQRRDNESRETIRRLILFILLSQRRLAFIIARRRSQRDSERRIFSAFSLYIRILILRSLMSSRVYATELAQTHSKLSTLLSGGNSLQADFARFSEMILAAGNGNSFPIDTELLARLESATALAMAGDDAALRNTNFVSILQGGQSAGFTGGFAGAVPRSLNVSEFSPTQASEHIQAMNAAQYTNTEAGAGAGDSFAAAESFDAMSEQRSEHMSPVVRTRSLIDDSYMEYRQASTAYLTPVGNLIDLSA
jgi:hypothetical protein